MPKKYSIIDKRQWLEDFEKGYSEASIKKKYRCDLRTLRKGVEEASHEREARAARIEVLKTALLDHQEQLKKKLRDIASAVSLPAQDWTILSWFRGGDSIFKPEDFEGKESPLFSKDMIYNLLNEHLKQDVLWKGLTAWERAFSSHKEARIILQKKVASILEDTTGLKLKDKPISDIKYLYSYTAGDLFYKNTLKWAFGDRKNDWLDRIVINTDMGEVRYGGNILAVIPGKEKECRDALVESFNEMQSLTENYRLVNTYKTLEEATAKLIRTIEEILILGVITGHCRVCKRLSS
jgi:hypothetical protein